MGAKTSILAYVEADAIGVLRTQPQPDRVATRQFVERLFPGTRISDARDGDLASYPKGLEVFAACFPGLSLVCAADLSLDYPSRLAPTFLQAGRSQRIYLHAMHSVVDWFAYAIWERGSLVRSLSLSPDSGILEDIGPRRPVEEPFWRGHHPMEASYPLKFHPLELAEEVLRDLFGFVLEGVPRDEDVDPFDIPLLGYVRAGRAGCLLKYLRIIFE